MKENETENLNNTEKNNTNSMNENNEKVHYEIKFVETEDGYRLEASGDKEALKRLGIGPNMVARGLKRGRGGRKGPRSRRHRGPGRPNRGPGRRAAMARRQRWMNRQWQFAGENQPGHPAFACGPRRGFHGARRPDQGAPGPGRNPGKGRPDSWAKGSEDTWDW